MSFDELAEAVCQRYGTRWTLYAVPEPIVSVDPVTRRPIRQDGRLVYAVMVFGQGIHGGATIAEAMRNALAAAADTQPTSAATGRRR